MSWTGILSLVILVVKITLKRFLEGFLVRLTKSPLRVNPKEIKKGL